VKCRAVLAALFALVYWAAPATAQIKPQPSAADARRRVRLVCSPRELFRGDTLHLEMSVPHGRDLAVISPGDDYYFLKYWDPEDKEATGDWFTFERQPALDMPTLTTVGEWSGAGDPRWERVFNKTGWYEVRLSYNLETDDGTPFQTCRVHYTDRERAAGAAEPAEAGEVRGAEQLEAALNQYEQLGRELAAARARAEAEAEREVGEKVRTGPKDEFETTAEYNARRRRSARLLAEAQARREQSLSKELAEADHKQREILARRYVAKVDAYLDPYDADAGAFTLIVDDPEDPVFTLPIPRDEARELKANLAGAVFEGVYRLSAAAPSPRPSPHLVAVRVTSRGKTYETAARAGSLRPTRKAIFTFRPEPAYTEVARKNNVSGTVRLRVLLRADGVAKVLSVVKGLPDGLTEKAVEAAEKIRFQPAERDGRPVSSVITLDYNFNVY
jgi:TonB family protein